MLPPSHMIMIDLVTVCVEVVRYTLEREFIGLICINPYMVLYLIVNQSNHGICVHLCLKHYNFQRKEINFL